MMEIPPVLVINLQERTDRWNDIQNDFKDWPFELERIDAIKEVPAQVACWKSHQKCISIAKERGYPWILILEDDCLPNSDGKDRFLELLPYLWRYRTQWDIFNGGAEIKEKEWVQKLIQTAPPIFQTKSIMTHFIIIHEEIYDRLLQAIPNKSAVDWYYTRNYRMWSTVPHIAIQKPGKSDIGNADDNRHLLKASEDYLYEYLDKHSNTTESNNDYKSSNIILFFMYIILALFYFYLTKRSKRFYL